MASVILGGTPAGIVNPAVSAVTAVVAGQFMSVDPTNPEQPVVSSTLTAGDGITIATGGVLQPISCNLDGGVGIVVNDPISPNDPIVIAASAAGAVTQLGTFGPTGAETAPPTPFVCPAAGWYLISATVLANGPNAAWTPGTSYFNFYVEKNTVADFPSYMTQYAQLPTGAEAVFQSMRYYAQGDSIVADVFWAGAANLGDGGSITMAIQQMAV
jgi:hypothetical protein